MCFFVYLFSPSHSKRERDTMEAKSVYEFEAPLLDGTVKKLSDYKGKALLIVNAAPM